MLSQPEYRIYFTLEVCTILFVPCHLFLRIFVTKLAPMYHSIFFYLLHCSSMPRSLLLCYNSTIVLPHCHECSAIQNVTKRSDVQHFFLVLSNIFPPLCVLFICLFQTIVFLRNISGAHCGRLIFPKNAQTLYQSYGVASEEPVEQNIYWPTIHERDILTNFSGKCSQNFCTRSLRPSPESGLRFLAIVEEGVSDENFFRLR